MKIVVISNEQGYVANGESREGKPERFVARCGRPLLRCFIRAIARSRFAERPCKFNNKVCCWVLSSGHDTRSCRWVGMLSDMAQREIDAQLRMAVADGGQANGRGTAVEWC